MLTALLYAAIVSPVIVVVFFAAWVWHLLAENERLLGENERARRLLGEQNAALSDVSQVLRDVLGVRV